ncbi:6990_t:CDS:2, partial [Scutellospora calospora]
AILSRALCGLLNAKSMLAEVTNKTNQKEAFSLPGLCWSFGSLALISFTGFIVGYFLLPETYFSNFEQKSLLHSNVELRSSNPNSRTYTYHQLRGLEFSNIKLLLILNSVGILNLIANFLQNSTPNYIIDTANGVAQTLSALAHVIGPAIH